MDKYQDLRVYQTHGINCDLETEDIIEKLNIWDERYGIEILNVESDRVKVLFKDIPHDVTLLVTEIYEFCPDITEQHFGCFQEMLEAAQEGKMDLPDSFYELVDGVDLEDEDYGIELLKKSLKRDKVVSFLWG
jgi:sRNA-binding carbon storage regulator CsrA